MMMMMMIMIAVPVVLESEFMVTFRYLIHEGDGKLVIIVALSPFHCLQMTGPSKVLDGW